MSTKHQGGAALQQYPLNLPGFMGLNTENRTAILGPEWATRLLNTVLDESNRVSSRKGWRALQTEGPYGTYKFTQMMEHINASDESELIAVADDNKIYRSSDGGTSFSDITGTATVTDVNMELIPFRDTVVGLQDGQAPIVYNGTSFSDVADASAPEGGIGVGAFGRVWAKTGPSVLAYSALLDETDWSGSDSGVFDLTSVWPTQDEIVAVAQFNSVLVIFGRNNILLYTDGAGSALGLDPIQAYVVDTVQGIGCAARDSVQSVKGDLVFADNTGLYSLARLLEGRANALNNLSTSVQSDIQTSIALVTSEYQIKGIYSPADRFYLLSISLGPADEENGRVYCFDTRSPMQDGSLRCAGVWDQLVPTANAVRRDLSFICARKTKPARVGVYDGNTDDGVVIPMVYESGWDSLGTTADKLLKRISSLLYVQANTPLVFRWAFDFSDSFFTEAVTLAAQTGVAEWNEAEWNEAEWGGGVQVQEKKVGGKGSGEYVKIGISATVNGSPVSIQNMAVYAKQGRIR